MKEESLIHIGGSLAAVFFSWVSFHVPLCVGVIFAVSLPEVQFVSAFVSITVGLLTLLRIVGHAIGKLIEWFGKRRAARRQLSLFGRRH